MGQTRAAFSTFQILSNTIVQFSVCKYTATQLNFDCAVNIGKMWMFGRQLSFYASLVFASIANIFNQIFCDESDINVDRLPSWVQLVSANDISYHIFTINWISYDFTWLFREPFDWQMILVIVQFTIFVHIFWHVSWLHHTQ